jgi:hypothetical protein
MLDSSRFIRSSRSLRVAARVWLILLALALASGGPAEAQIGGGQISGKVVDQAGAAVPGATVTARNSETGSLRTTVSTDAGIYTLAGLRPGSYQVDVELSGFRPAAAGCGFRPVRPRASTSR